MQGKGKSIYTNQAQQDMKRRRQIRSWLILIGVVVAVFVALRLLQKRKRPGDLPGRILDGSH